MELFELKIDSKGSFTTRRDPKGHKLVKNADLKIWSFLAKKKPMDLPLGKNSSLVRNKNILLKALYRINVFENVT